MAVAVALAVAVAVGVNVAVAVAVGVAVGSKKHFFKQTSYFDRYAEAGKGLPLALT